MKIKVNEASGVVLDWLVAKCEGYSPISHSRLATVMVERRNARGVMQPEHITSLRFSSNWAQGGPIIEREKLGVIPHGLTYKSSNLANTLLGFGDTPLVAAMRSFVLSKLGDEVDVPNELVERPSINLV